MPFAKVLLPLGGSSLWQGCVAYLGKMPSLVPLVGLALGIHLERHYNWITSHKLGAIPLVCGLLLFVLFSWHKARQSLLRHYSPMLWLAVLLVMLPIGGLRMAGRSSMPRLYQEGRGLASGQDYMPALEHKLRHEGVEGEAVSLLSALSLGYMPKEPQRQELRGQFALSGAAHLLVVSGFHLGLVVGCLGLLFNRLRLYKLSLYSLLLIVSAWAFVWLTGAGIATVRAALMLSLFLGGRLLGREPYLPNLVAVTALVQLLYEPMNLYSWGAWLSYTAVVSIYLYYKPINESIGRLRQPILRYLWSALSLSLSAQILTLPLVLHLFGFVSWSFILTTIPLVLLAVLLIPIGLISYALLALSCPLWLLPEGINFLARLMLALSSWASRMEVLHLSYELPWWGLILCWFIAVATHLTLGRVNPSDGGFETYDAFSRNGSK